MLYAAANPFLLNKICLNQPTLFKWAGHIGQSRQQEINTYISLNFYFVSFISLTIFACSLLNAFIIPDVSFGVYFHAHKILFAAERDFYFKLAV